ncbi:MAG: hypothetical protein QOE92_1832 [Chloroflexota bacterium]|nr:hypothetical protein [Chloroflexota bacterium]
MSEQPPSQPPPQAPPPASGGGTGLQPNVAALLCDLLCLVGGIVFLVIEKENREVKFHAWQSIILFGAYIVLYIVLTILAFIIPPIAILGLFLGLGYLVVTIILMIRSYQGQLMKLPIIGDFAAQQAGL